METDRQTLDDLLDVSDLSAAAMVAGTVLQDGPGSAADLLAAAHRSGGWPRVGQVFELLIAQGPVRSADGAAIAALANADVGIDGLSNELRRMWDAGSALPLGFATGLVSALRFPLSVSVEALWSSNADPAIGRALARTAVDRDASTEAARIMCDLHSRGAIVSIGELRAVVSAFVRTGDLDGGASWIEELVGSGVSEIPGGQLIAVAVELGQPAIGERVLRTLIEVGRKIESHHVVPLQRYYQRSGDLEGTLRLRGLLSSNPALERFAPKGVSQPIEYEPIVRGVITRRGNDHVLVRDVEGRDVRIPFAEFSDVMVIDFDQIDQLDVVILRTVAASDGTFLGSNRRAARVKRWIELIDSGPRHTGTVLHDNGRSWTVDAGLRLRLEKHKLPGLQLNDDVQVTFGSSHFWANMAKLSNDRQRSVWANYQVGQVLDVVVTGIAAYGVFATNGEVSGLIHISELGHEDLDPARSFSIGDNLNVSIVRIDPEAERMSLSIKALLPRPYEAFRERYSVGDSLEVVVSSVSNFGALVHVEGVRGLIHFSTIPGCGFGDPHDIFFVGERINATILEMLDERERISFSTAS